MHQLESGLKNRLADIHVMFTSRHIITRMGSSSCIYMESICNAYTIKRPSWRPLIAMACR